MGECKKRVVSLVISLMMVVLTLSAAVPAKRVEAASKYIKVDAFIKYAVQQLNLPLDKSSKTPYIDAALKVGILNKDDFTSYTEYLTRTDCAVIANRIDEYLYGAYFGYAKEVYELLKDCNYYNGRLYYNTKGKLYPEGEDDYTYQAKKFLNDVVVPRLEKHFTFKAELDACYDAKYDDGGKMLDLYVTIGLEDNNSLDVGVFEESDYLIQAWNKILDGERKVAAVYSKRISDFNNVVKRKRQDVAEAFAKGIIKGYSNGYYVQNRELRGSENISASGAKSVVALALNKDNRAMISPDGQLIRTKDLPKNASEYPYILECFPNEFYEMIFYFQRLKPYKEGTMDRSEYRYPVESGNTYLMDKYGFYVSVDMKPYEYYDTIIEKVGVYVNSVFNVNYSTVNQKWIDRLASAYVPTLEPNSTHEKINRYLNAMKKNHVIVESKVIAIEPSTMYVCDGKPYIRIYAKYRVIAEAVNVEDDYDLLFGNLHETYLVGLQNGVWTYGFYDIPVFGTNINDVMHLEYGVSGTAGISDEPLRGSK